MFERILVARRGEVAARVARTGKRLENQVLALHSLPGESVHVEACDAAYHVDAVDGVIPVETVVAKAKEAKVDAVYPGYASHSAYGALARALEAEGIPFVGIDPDVLEFVSDRLGLRSRAQELGLRAVPGELVADVADGVAAADRLGFPVALRTPRAGGVELAIVHDEDELPKALEGAFATLQARVSKGPVARRGNPRLVVERFVPRARRIDVLLIADAEGDIAALCERECSIADASGTTLITECPSPELQLRNDGEALREMMYDQALRVGRSLDFEGLLSVRFLLDAAQEIHFEGATLGLPVMHGVMEMVTGLDLVALQLKTAAGEPLPEEVRCGELSGHAAAARVLAVDEEQRSTEATQVYFPSGSYGSLRVEPSIAEGVATPPDDWPRVVRATAAAPIRHQALLILDRTLAALRVPPLTTNVGELRKVLTHEQFRAGQYDREFEAVPVERLESRTSDPSPRDGDDRGQKRRGGGSGGRSGGANRSGSGRGRQRQGNGGRGRRSEGSDRRNNGSGGEQSKSDDGRGRRRRKR